MFQFLRKVLMIELAGLNRFLLGQDLDLNIINSEVSRCNNNILADLTNDVLSVKSKFADYINIKLGKKKQGEKT
ncbi:MAG: hypothetical protein CM1200mP33_5460 [Chloroflexota bacterium]|nr:MAG: hypothetical protein CM1200mP33_5460 [Chloroflexota bacterium]